MRALTTIVGIAMRGIGKQFPMAGEVRIITVISTNMIRAILEYLFTTDSLIYQKLESGRTVVLPPNPPSPPPKSPEQTLLNSTYNYQERSSSLLQDQDDKITRYASIMSVSEQWRSSKELPCLSQQLVSERGLRSEKQFVGISQLDGNDSFVSENNDEKSPGYLI